MYTHAYTSVHGQQATAMAQQVTAMAGHVHTMGGRQPSAAATPARSDADAPAYPRTCILSLYPSISLSLSLESPDSSFASWPHV